jgi:[ribosomal protein S5]-alanine N-acetyltransferase
MIVYAETDRLLLRELVESDAAGMWELDSNPAVHKFLGNNPVTDMQQIHDVIQFVRRQYEENGIGRWAVEEKGTGQFVGWAGLKKITETVNGHINHLDVGYRLIERFWGMGIATEATLASLRYGFNTLNAAEIFATTEPGHEVSGRVLRKCGLKLMETIEYEGDAYHWYRISKQEWESRDLNSGKAIK